MGTQGPGRKRIPNRDKMKDEDEALNQIAREAEARLAARRAARAEAREIRMKELERQQKEMSDDEEKMSVGSRGSLRVEERPDRDFVDKGSRTASTLSAATLASLGGASSRRGSCDTTFSVETEASIRDMKDSLAEAEEKFRRAMVSNAQLHNDKTALMFQVDSLKEELSTMEELLWESRRCCEDRTKEVQRQHQAHSVLQFQFRELEETLRSTEELLTKHGVVVSAEVPNNGEAGPTDDVSADSASLLAQEGSPGGRESMLGKPPEDAKLPPNDVKYERRRSRSFISTKTWNKRSRTGGKKPPRNKAREGNAARKSQISNDSSAEKVHESRLVAPRPAREILLDHKARLAGRIWIRVADGDVSRGGSQPGQEVVPEPQGFQIHEFSPPKSASSLNQNEFVEESAECDVDESVGRRSDGPEGRVLEAKLQPSVLEPRSTAVTETTPAAPEDAPDRSVRGVVQKAETETPRIPVELLEDWSSLEETIRILLTGFIEGRGSALSEVTESLSRWSADLKKTLEKVAGTTGQMRAECGPEGSQSAAGPSGTLEGLEVQDHQDPPSRTPQVDSGNPEAAKRTLSSPPPTSWSEDLVFTEFYFSETKNVPKSRPARRRTLSQRSKVRRLVGELTAMALPELLLLSLQDGTIVQDPRGADDQEQRFLGFMDSCEEVDEGKAWQPQPTATEVAVEDAVAEELQSGRKGRDCNIS